MTEKALVALLMNCNSRNKTCVLLLDCWMNDISQYVKLKKSQIGAYESHSESGTYH